MAPHKHNEQDDELTMSTNELLQGQLELYHHCLAFVKSLALKAATDLRIPDAISRRGGAATLSELAAEIKIHPTKLSNLRRLMRVLTTSGVFSLVQGKDEPCDGAAAPPEYYELTVVSRLLVERSPHDLSPMVDTMVDPVSWNALLKMPEWFTEERPSGLSLIEVAQGCDFWDTTVGDGGKFSGGMAADSRVAMQVLLKEHGGVFKEVKSSLVDVGGSHGATATAVAKAFPHLKCTVLDLADVVALAPANDRVTFVAGDMFKYVPPADAVLLKWILHDWKHEDCVKIMRLCKEAIPERDAGGKVIIIDMVVGYPVTQQHDSKEAQAFFDVYMMGMDGIEREESEWSMIFSEAGFSDYKITPTNGIRSIIEVFP
ncbi:hypothetical protein QYE76_047656 [Lolium multiflorum]|uniref:acetylserotonin O-methyltransferase n=1 Tax=Lolium multiflorum TaxID=4521 RepID=A0AAD8X262_LOLMU|nr:hypothetical protein QYE76_047656 [Lolium multiflorum]